MHRSSVLWADATEARKMRLCTFCKILLQPFGVVDLLNQYGVVWNGLAIIYFDQPFPERSRKMHQLIVRDVNHPMDVM